jgi:hypothetical protein
MATVEPWYVDNDNLIQHSPTDRDGNPVIGATLAVTMYFLDGTEVAGPSWPLDMPESTGVYEVIVDKDELTDIAIGDRLSGRIVIADGAGGDGGRLISYRVMEYPA